MKLWNSGATLVAMPTCVSELMSGRWTILVLINYINFMMFIIANKVLLGGHNYPIFYHCNNYILLLTTVKWLNKKQLHAGFVVFSYLRRTDLSPSLLLATLGFWWSLVLELVLSVECIILHMGGRITNRFL